MEHVGAVDKASINTRSNGATRELSNAALNNHHGASRYTAIYYHDPTDGNAVILHFTEIYSRDKKRRRENLYASIRNDDKIDEKSRVHRSRKWRKLVLRALERSPYHRSILIFRSERQRRVSLCLLLSARKREENFERIDPNI